MGWFDRLLGRPPPPVEYRKGVCVIRDREVAASLRLPDAPTFGEATEPCASCGRAMAASIITTGGPFGDPALWNDVPVCVDGWVCEPCGVFRYPRPMDADAINGVLAEAVRAGKAGDYAAAEWGFTRAVWDWPDFLFARVDLAFATGQRLDAVDAADTAQRRRLAARMREHYEAAVDIHARDPRDGNAKAVARAAIALAELALEDRAPDRARRALALFATLRDPPAEDTERAAFLQNYLDQRVDLYQSAAEALFPYLHLMDRKALPIDTPEARQTVVQALADLAAHARIAPDYWRTRWALAMGHAALGDRDRALELWTALAASHPHERDVVREASLALLRADRAAEALAVNRAGCAHRPDDATLWCNRAVCELLAGDLAAARECLDRSDALDPSDAIAKKVRRKVAAVEAGAPRPRTLRELEGR